MAQNAQDLEAGLWAENRILIAPHPNIVKMYSVFADSVPNMSDSMDLYPDALPSRINPNGYGRNMSLFLVMKKYRCSLRKYLDEKPDSSWRTSLAMLTQLLEGLVHLSRYEVAHRDLKTDNILVDYDKDSGLAELVITDFGCCLADRRNGFRCPYPTYEVDRGGNAALMAPEVANASPGLFSFINYAKADVWAAGTIAYEIFGEANPFYKDNDNNYLDSRTYK